MDNKEKNIKSEVEKTLQSLDNSPRLQENPWLFARIEERLKEPDKPSNSWSFARLLQPAIISCLLILNVWTAYTVFSNSSLVDESNTETLTDEYAYLSNQSIEDYIPE